MWSTCTWSSSLTRALNTDTAPWKCTRTLYTRTDSEYLQLFCVWKLTTRLLLVVSTVSADYKQNTLKIHPWRKYCKRSSLHETRLTTLSGVVPMRDSSRSRRCSKSATYIENTAKHYVHVQETCKNREPAAVAHLCIVAELGLLGFVEEFVSDVIRSFLLGTLRIRWLVCFIARFEGVQLSEETPGRAHGDISKQQYLNVVLQYYVRS